jgi:tetratricopeptide (TPR) repeat protein
VFAATSPSDGQGIAYYRAGFPLVAKPLLITEIETDSASRPETCFNLGNIYFADNQLDSAGYTFQKGLASNPFNSLNAIGLTMLKIKSNPTVADEEFKNILKLKQNKKNVDILIAIANAYLFNGVLESAVQYQELAKALKSKYAPVYVLLGDIEVAKKNVGEACKNYEQAIYFDDKCKEAFIKYARAYRTVNPALAIEKLNALKAKEPSFLLVDRELADIYYATNDFGKAAELYDNYLKSGNSNIQDFTKYAFTLFLKGDFVKSLEVTNMGLVKATRNPVFNRLAMYNNVELTKVSTTQGNKDEARQKNAEALKAADLFFNHSDKPEFTFLDHRYYGQAYRDEDSLNLAISEYEKALKLDSTRTELWKDISDMNAKKSDYKKAILAYNKYFNPLAEENKTPDVYMQYGRLCYNMSVADTTLSVINKKAALLTADSLFKIVATKETDNYRGNYWRARTNAALDPNVELEVAKSLYDITTAFVEAKADPRYNSVLVECYRYDGIYYVQRNDNTTAIKYFNKMLTIEPKNAFAKNALQAIESDIKNAKERAARAAAKTKK